MIGHLNVTRIAATTDWLMCRGDDIRRCMKYGFDTRDIASAYFVSEAAVWNRLVHDGY